MNKNRFFNLYSHDLIRVAVARPITHLSVPQQNIKNHRTLIHKALENQASLVVFPELSITGYSCEDLFHQSTLIEATEEAILSLLHETQTLPILIILGAPIRLDEQLFNCALLLLQGKIIGIIPKSYLPNHREYYEQRHFCSGFQQPNQRISYAHCANIPFGRHWLFQATNQPKLTLALEICEDLWAPLPPSTWACLAGASVVANLSASNASVGKADYRRSLISQQSARSLTAYLYASAGWGESTTDLAWDGHSMIAEQGQIISESSRFQYESSLLLADIDLLRTQQDRMHNSTFTSSKQHYSKIIQNFEVVPFLLPIPTTEQLPLLHPPRALSYVPQQTEAWRERCYEVFEIQIHGLARRLQSSGLKHLVLGLSGGLDSTLAALVAVQALARLHLPASHLIGVTLPGPGSGQDSLSRAKALMNALSIESKEISITSACNWLLEVLNHPSTLYDTTYENIQAGERSQLLFRLANQHGALLVGTSDLSELALGWCTYGVGDHMAHYHVNASVPKTLVQQLLQWSQQQPFCDLALQAVLQAVLEAEISPELIPSNDPQTIQKTESTIGPYELQDYFLYYFLRFGYPVPRIAFMAWCSWGHRYDLATIHHWLGVFIQRFFEDSQFKRSCIANSPKVGTGGSLSPRGDWRAPSDASAQVWLDQWRQIPIS